MRRPAALLLVASVACTQVATDAPAPVVVASIAPLAEVTARVAGSGIDVATLTPAGVEPHDLELSPSRVELVLRADLVVYVGSGFQPAVADAVARRAGPSLEIAPDEGDPHVWLDPVQMAAIAEEIAAAVSDLVPAADADPYAAELRALDQDFSEGLNDCARTTIVTAHAAFGHLADRYGLTQEAIAGISPENEPRPGRLAELVDLVERTGTTTVFTEELVDPAVAETLAREAGVATAVLDPIEGIPDGESYASMMRENLRILREALECT